jgi:hypothetical protein
MTWLRFLAVGGNFLPAAVLPAMVFIHLSIQLALGAAF